MKEWLSNFIKGIFNKQKNEIKKEEHNKEKETLERMIVGIDLAAGEDKVGIIKNTFRRKSSKKNISRKSEEEKQLDKLYYLYTRVKKNRVKKKIFKRICKLKRKTELIKYE